MCAMATPRTRTATWQDHENPKIKSQRPMERSRPVDAEHNMNMSLVPFNRKKAERFPTRGTECWRAKLLNFLDYYVRKRKKDESRGSSGPPMPRAISK